MSFGCDYWGGPEIRSYALPGRGTTGPSAALTLQQKYLHAPVFFSEFMSPKPESAL